MFRLGIYTLYDKLSKRHLAPFPSENDETAERQFRLMLADRNMVFAQHPEDYALFRIGEFWPLTGVLNPEAEIVRLVDEQPGVRADVARAEQEGVAKFGAWLQKQATEGVDVRKLLEGRQ